MNNCRECAGELEIIGTGGFGDTVMVICEDCRIEYEVEPDGLGMGGMELMYAKQAEGTL